MKYVKNDGLTEDSIVQNRFTAYLSAAVSHHRARHLAKENLKQAREMYLEDLHISQETSEQSSITYTDIIEADERLHRLIFSLKEINRSILLQHVVIGTSLYQISCNLHMNYSTVKSIYRRTLIILKKELDSEI